jgi:phage terminase large subunit
MANNPPADPQNDPKTAQKIGAAKNDDPVKQFVEVYRNNPVEFVRIVLGGHPLRWQRRLLRRIAAGRRRISIRAGHGVGKSTALSWAILWFMVTRFPQKTVCTAPTASQLYDALFAELKSWFNKLPQPIQDLYDVVEDKIRLRAAPEESFVSARTSSREKPEALAGIHSANVLIVVDEASGVDEAVFESAAGSMSGENACTVLLSNPTRSSGLFYKSHHELGAEYDLHHVSCVGNPLVSPDFVRQIAVTYGEESNVYRVRVLGEFPLQDDDTLIGADMVDAAMGRDIVPDMDAPLVYGVDPARYGRDSTALCKRRGDVVLEIKTWSGMDLMATTGRIMAEAAIDHPDQICVDTIGIGSGVADRLRELGQPVYDVNVGEIAAMSPTAARLRDELWIQVRDFLAQRGCRLPRDEYLRAELITPTYEYQSNGKIKVEAKDQTRKKLGRSPDRADALCMTFAGIMMSVGGRRNVWPVGKPLRRGISTC